MEKFLFFILLVALAISSQIQHYGCIQPNPKRKFKLTFQYACRQGVSFSSCEGDVFWNGKKIFSVAPKDYKVRTQTIQVLARVGNNVLRFRGTGRSDSYGLTIDNVKLIRYGSNISIIVNGGFEKPSVGKGRKILDYIPGWRGNGFQIGSGHLYNSRWGQTQVCELDGYKNAFLTQRWRFNKDYNIVKNSNPRNYKLEFQYACRQGKPLESCQGNVFWNGKNVLSIKPNNYNVVTKLLYVDIEVGQNMLKFKGTGCSDGYGLTIDNVELVRYGTRKNIVVNGGFQKPSVGRGSKVFNYIPGWSGKGFQIGSAHLYNYRWGQTQVCELDGHQNAFLTQRWRFNKDYIQH